MINAINMLAMWGICLACLFGFIWLITDDGDYCHRFLGKVTLLCIGVGVASSVIRELLLTYN